MNWSPTLNRLSIKLPVPIKMPNPDAIKAYFVGGKVGRRVLQEQARIPIPQKSMVLDPTSKQLNIFFDIKVSVENAKIVLEFADYDIFVSKDDEL